MKKFVKIFGLCLIVLLLGTYTIKSIDPFVAEDNKLKLLGNLSEWCSMTFENPIQSFIFMRNLNLDKVKERAVNCPNYHSNLYKVIFPEKQHLQQQQPNL
jgi:hypothetical protein